MPGTAVAEIPEIPATYHVFVKADGAPCPWCAKALALLEEKSLRYDVTFCESWKDLECGLAEYGVGRPAAKTFPQIVNVTTKTLIGGYVKLVDVIDEPILEPNPLRFTLFPLEHHDLFEYYKKAIASFWTPEEISLAQDATDWGTKLSANDRFFISHVLAFFAGSDGIVMENLAANFAKEVQIPEARQFYASQMMIEAVHSEVYALLIETLADSKDALRLFRAIETVPSVRKKAAWAQKWMDPSRRFAERLVAFACVEGILFSGSFCSIYWIKRRGVMPGLTLSNEFISRDEGLHYQFGCALYGKLKHKLADDVVRAIVTEAVDTELEFVVDAIPCRLVGMNADLMQQYIKFVADRAMQDLGYAKIYDVVNPFPWMELIGLQGKTNFFEQQPSQYQRAGILGSSEDRLFATDDVF